MVVKVGGEETSTVLIVTKQVRRRERVRKLSGCSDRQTNRQERGECTSSWRKLMEREGREIEKGRMTQESKMNGRSAPPRSTSSDRKIIPGIFILEPESV